MCLFSSFLRMLLLMLAKEKRILSKEREKFFILHDIIIKQMATGDQHFTILAILAIQKDFCFREIKAEGFFVVCFVLALSLGVFRSANVHMLLCSQIFGNKLKFLRVGWRITGLGKKVTQ